MRLSDGALAPALLIVLVLGAASALGAQPGRAGGTARAAPVTAQHLRTAFRDSLAREMLWGARRARLELDSALMSYDARGYQRVSVGVGFSEQGRDRLAYRREGATRVQWDRNVGALVEVEGARLVSPVVGVEVSDSGAVADARDEMLDYRNQLPYFPGGETLWIGSDVVRSEVNEANLVHPLASGSEAYYQYASGDRMTYTLPDGSQIRLMELLVTPRQPEWNLVVGSFWFDMANFHLVRAVYRLAVPLEVRSFSFNESESVGSVLARTVLSPLRGTVSSIAVEYALYEGRFWLPRLRTAEGIAQISFVRLPFELQQSFSYLSVNKPVEVPEIAITPEMARRDSIILRDSLMALDDPEARARGELLTAALARRTGEPTLAELRERAAAGDMSASIELSRRRSRGGGVCDTAAAQTRVARTPNRSTMVLLTATCNDSLLVNSQYLPSSIYSTTDELARSLDIESLRQRLGPGVQARFSPRFPTVDFGFGDGLLRYNRVEGLSPGIAVKQALGAGLSLGGVVRAGTADGHLNAELGVQRSHGTVTVGVTGYKRLVALNDWGNPLSFGSSFVALVGGRDEGFYYRARGGELSASAPGNPGIRMRVYAERHGSAGVNASFSVAKALGGKEFGPNIVAADADIVGAGFTLGRTFGEDPRALRAAVLLKGESGMGDFNFGRGLADFSVSRSLFGAVTASLGASVGSSMGELPPQRNFMLGGTQSVRGQRAGSAFGDAFWLGRVEVGNTNVAARRVFFADLGWAGSREDWGRQSRALSGAGVGLSLLDGLLRFDLARGIYPGTGWRFASYLEGRF